MRVVVACAAILVLTAAGCGSTNRQITAYSVGGDGAEGSADGAGPTGEGVDADGDGIPDGTSDDTTGGGGEGSAGGSGGSGGSGRTGGGDDGGGGGGGGGSGSVPGVTDTAVKVGVVYFEGTDAMARSVGSGLNVFGDFKAYYEVVIKHLNANGGVLGRKVEPVFRAFDAQRSDTSVQEQANCDALTSDTKVFAVLAPTRQSDTFRACLQRAGVLYLGLPGTTPADARTYSQFRNYLEAGSLNLSRLAAQLTDALVAEGFLTSQSVIGVATFDEPSYKRAIDRQLKPALARHNMRIKEVVAVPLAANTSEQGATATAIRAAVVRMQQSNVDRVIFLQNGVTLPLFFMTTAAGQTYNPRYALNSTEAPTSLQEQNVPHSQLEGSVGLGWIPTTDLKASEDTTTPEQQACLATMEAGGRRAERRSFAAAMYAVCDHVGVFAAAATKAGRLQRGAFITALEALEGYPSAVTFSLGWGRDRHDGVSAVRTLKFVKECPCFRYTSGVRAI